MAHHRYPLPLHGAGGQCNGAESHRHSRRRRNTQRQCACQRPDQKHSAAARQDRLSETDRSQHPPRRHGPRRHRHAGDPPYPGRFVYAAPPEVARDSCHMVNDHIAGLVAKHPDRLMGMGTVPLQDPGMAVAELDRTVKQLGFRGVELCTNVRGVDLTRAGLEKFFARVEELDVMIFLHPFGTSLVGRMEDHYFPNTIGHPLDSALCVGQLVFDGYLERFPKLKICIAHGGGYIPGYWGRFDHAWAHREDCRVTIKKKPSEYLKKLYFDTVVFDERELKHLIEIWGADHIMLGTDYPFDMAEPDPVGFLGRVNGISERDMALVAGGNAARLLGLPAKV
ncbi:amidohydrolase [Bradyrhizobium sp. AUGA SZCCT0431]|nr:amidohydrolase [Bradyrhizobium sp. AUGA SZCCT0431]